MIQVSGDLPPTEGSIYHFIKKSEIVHFGDMANCNHFILTSSYNMGKFSYSLVSWTQNTLPSRALKMRWLLRTLVNNFPRVFRKRMCEFMNMLSVIIQSSSSNTHSSFTVLIDSAHSSMSELRSNGMPLSPSKQSQNNDGFCDLAFNSFEFSYSLMTLLNMYFTVIRSCLRMLTKSGSANR